MRDTKIDTPIERSYGRHALYVYVVEHSDRDGILDRLAATSIVCFAGGWESYNWVRILVKSGYGTDLLWLLEK